MKDATREAIEMRIKDLESDINMRTERIASSRKTLEGLEQENLKDKESVEHLKEDLNGGL
jgi:cell division protein FtsB